MTCNLNRQQLLELVTVLGAISWLCISLYVIASFDLPRVQERSSALKAQTRLINRTQQAIQHKHLLDLMKRLRLANETSKVTVTTTTRERRLDDVVTDNQTVWWNTSSSGTPIVPEAYSSTPVGFTQNLLKKFIGVLNKSFPMKYFDEKQTHSERSSESHTSRHSLVGHYDQRNSTFGSNDNKTDGELNTNTTQGSTSEEMLIVETQLVKPLTERKLTPIKNKNVRRFPFHSDDPGEDGDPVLSDRQEEADRAYKAFSFNDHVSQKISVERSIPDTRHENCRHKRYDYAALPRASIIICFTNESHSALIRSVHSIINRTPTKLIREILLVDDFSQLPHLRRPLDDYVAANFRSVSVKVIRLPCRHGIARARMAGLDAATGDVVTFLDSHVECNVGWLEPLLDAVAADRRTVASPVIDTVEDTTFRYVASSAEMRGGFNWDMQFIWAEIPRDEAIRRNKSADGLAEPIRTPTIAGGLFAIDRKWFLELGGHDPGLEIWGAENLELSFKTWMCGGRLLIVPCSRVGHVFRSNAPYTFTGNDFKILSHNNGRVASVWMDDYGKLFLHRFPDALDPINSTADRMYDLEARHKLRRDLGCGTFASYLDTAYRELYRPSLEPVARGQLRHIASGLCMFFDKVWGLSANRCVSDTGDLYFQLSPIGHIEHVDYCLGTFSSGNKFLTLVECNDEKSLIVQHNGPEDVLRTADQWCVSVEKAHKSRYFLVVLVQCSGTALDLLHWTFTEYT